MTKINNKGVISIAVVIGILAGVLVLGFGGYKTVNHFQTTGLIKQAERMEVSENYEEAVNLLEKAQAKAFTKGTKDKINEELKKYKQLAQDKVVYNQGVEKFNNNDWQGAIDLFTQVSSLSPLYQDSQAKINKATEEIEKIKKDEEEKKIKESEEKAREEAEATYQAKLKKEQEAKQKVEEEKKTEKEIIQSSGLILCNGQYWQPCPIGQKFYCPPTGNAECLIEEETQETITEIDLQEEYSIPSLTQNQNSTVEYLFNNNAIIISSKESVFLGKITNQYDIESVLNKYGNYGSKYSPDSIFNKYGNYGGKYSIISPFNKYSSNPPKIYIGNAFWGYLSRNKYLSGSTLDPNDLLLFAYLKYNDDSYLELMITD